MSTSLPSGNDSVNALQRKAARPAGTVQIDKRLCRGNLDTFHLQRSDASMSARISVDHLWTYDPGDSSVRLPIDKLEHESWHVHGHLNIEIGGRGLPSLGFLGPDDVCLSTWMQELLNIIRQLSQTERSSYTFDDGEQGQPAYEFRRESAWLFVSIKDSLLSDGSGDPSYQNVACLWEDFVIQVQKFASTLREEIESNAGETGARWWLTQAQRAV